ncbi:TPA: restriction endonuclease subunit S [Streptococcus suis]
MVDERKVPEGWVVKKLKDLSTMKSGNSITSKKINDYDKIPCYGGNGLRGYTYDYTHEGEYALIGRQGALCGNVQFVSGVFFASEHAIVVTPNDETDIKWLFYMLTDMGLNKYSESSAQPGLSVIKILNLELVAPADRIEQKFIAEALSDTDNLIQSLENLIDKKKKIKQGAMQQLLTGKKRLPGFSGEWRKVKVKDIGYAYGGLSGKSKSDFDGGNKPYITFLNVMNNTIIEISSLRYVRVKSSESQNRVNTGDLLFNTSSETPEEVGMCSVLLGEIDELYLNSFCFGFRIYDQNLFEPLYLAYFFRSNEGRKLFFSLAQGATRYNLSKNLFYNIEFKHPSIQEQKAIAQVLSDMDNEIEALEEKLEKYKTIKQGMMQELLTGRIRLI